MAVVKEVLEAIKLLGDGVKSMEAIVTACGDGKKYLMNRHPDVAADLAAMCVEIQKTLLAMATASSVVTNFRFTIAGEAVATEPRRFNQAFIAHKPVEAEFRAQINRSRGRCSQIGTHARRMQEKANGTDLSSVFSLLGVPAKERQLDLARTLQMVYDDDRMFHDVVDQMTIAVTATFRAVQDALGPSGAMDPARVVVAAKVLGEHADEFLPIESRCLFLAGELQKVIDASGVGSPRLEGAS